ncbi:MAG: oxygen-independent coproporphyrinogen III oxidase [Pseudolabrys sp.]
MTAARLFGLAAQNVPRYTSYPTAPHFGDAVGEDDYAAWLDALPAETSLSVYLHVPYCTELCHYCGCATKAVRRREPVEAYARLLLAELDLLKTVAGRRLKHLHWGGGTPSILGGDAIAAIVDRLSALFDVDAVREHAIELDPRRHDRNLVRVLAACGVTRASLGVQDVNPEVQRAIGRVQPFKMVAALTEALRGAGIAGINFDLMYGLPRQSIADVVRTADLAMSLRPDRIALFGYAHVPWMRTHQKLIDEADLPGLAERIAQAEAAAEVFAAHGYVPVGLDHFALQDDVLALAARKRRLRRNFQGYTTDAADALIGVGATAIGQLPQGYVQNAPDVAGYARAITAGHLATKRGLALNGGDRMRGAIIEQLMCNMAADLGAYGGREAFEPEFARLLPLIDRGLVELSGNTITVTEAGRPYLRLAAAAFDAYLPENRARHSVAV